MPEYHVVPGYVSGNERVKLATMVSAWATPVVKNMISADRAAVAVAVMPRRPTRFLREYMGRGSQRQTPVT
ncbi:hypothetical protein GCM10009838_51230 [Catenulispora subtropica]|uniref:Uncharacterized protein n=1 Tax=Catenulispora subtropica TaxID=450798 RepID=A0ABN2SCI2_9ACTN